MSSAHNEAPAPSQGPMVPKRSSLLRSSAIMASGTLISRILGFVRNAMLLAAIGSVGGGVMAAFQTANTLPNMVFNILAAGVLDAVLVPQIVRALKKDDGQVFVNRLLTAAGLILFVLTVVAMIAAPLLIMMTAASYSDEIRALSIAFALVCLPQIFFYGVYNLLGEVLNARGIFGPYMWAPVVNNIVGIGGLGIFLYMWGTHPTILPIADFTSSQFWILAGSATLGVISQALVLVIPLRNAGIRLRPDFHFRGTSFGSIPRVVGWTFGILAISQVGIFSTSNLVAMADAWAHTHQPNLSAINDASQIVVGNAAYATAFMIFMVPQSLIAVSLATALFTRLSHAASNDDHQEVARQFHISVRAISTLNLLAAAILTAGSIPMMRLVNYRAEEAIVEAYAWVLMAMLPGVASIGLVLMSQRIFFAYEDAKPAFIAGIVPNILQVVVGWGLYFLTGPVWWVVGASFAEAVCRTSQGFISLRLSQKVNPHIDSRQLIGSFMRAAAAAVVAAAAGFGVMALLGWHAHAQTSLGRMLISILHLSLVAIVATIVFWLVLRRVSPGETQEVGGMIVQRFPMPPLAQHFFVGSPSAKRDSADETTLKSPDGDADDTDSEDSMSDHSTGDSPFGGVNTPSGHTGRSGEHSPQDNGWGPPATHDPVHAGTPADETVPHGQSTLPDNVLQEDASQDVDVTRDRVHAMPWQPVSFTNDTTTHTGSSSTIDSPVGITPTAEGSDDAMSEQVGEDFSGAEAAGASVTVGASATAGAVASERIGQTLKAMGPMFSTLAGRMRSSLNQAQDKLSQAQDKLRAAGEESERAEGLPALDSHSDHWQEPEAHTVTRRSYKDKIVHGFEANPAAAQATAPVAHFSRAAVIFFLVFSLIATIWAVRTATSPIDWNAPSFVLDSAPSLPQSESSQSDTPSDTSGDAPTAPAPKIASVQVISWRDDQGDNENHAINMIDGNLETEWHSRQFDGPFGPDTGIALVVKLDKPTTVSEVVLTMHDTTTGGELNLTRNADNPRKGEVLVTQAMGPQTTLTLPQAQELDSFVLRFSAVPQSVDGALWAWIYDIAVK